MYVLGGAVRASLLLLTITPFGMWGANQRIANTLLALLRLGTTLAGRRAARAGRDGEHREWTVRSIALAFSIVANRVWSIACIVVLASGAPAAEGALVPTPELAQARRPG